MNRRKTQRRCRAHPWTCVVAFGAGTLALAGGPGPAAAQPTPADQAAAEALFNEARRLIEQDKPAEACPKFLESHRLDPASGTLLNLGDCYERAGQTASAWGAFQEALVMARNASDTLREDEARRRAAALEPQLSRLLIEIAPENRTLGIELKQDARPLGQGLWGSAVPVDPGVHAIEVSAPGRQTWRTITRVPPGPGTTIVTVPPLTAAPSPPRTPDHSPETRFWSAQRIAGAALGGAGLAGAVVGAIFGARASSSMSDSEVHCGPGDPGECNAEGVALRQEADRAATTSTVAFLIGSAAIAGGVVLFATAPAGGKPREAVLQFRLQPRRAGAFLTGAW